MSVEAKDTRREGGRDKDTLICCSTFREAQGDAKGPNGAR